MNLSDFRIEGILMKIEGKSRLETMTEIRKTPDFKKLSLRDQRQVEKDVEERFTGSGDMNSRRDYLIKRFGIKVKTV